MRKPSTKAPVKHNLFLPKTNPFLPKTGKHKVTTGVWCSTAYEMATIMVRVRVAIKPIATVYSYHNESSRTYANLGNQLWEQNGRISFVSKGTATDWHGSFQHQRNGGIVLQFDCEGDPYTTKTARLLRTSDTTYEGSDHEGCFIAMREIARYESDGTNWTRLS